MVFFVVERIAVVKTVVLPKKSTYNKNLLKVRAKRLRRSGKHGKNSVVRQHAKYWEYKRTKKELKELKEVNEVCGELKRQLVVRTVGGEGESRH